MSADDNQGQRRSDKVLKCKCGMAFENLWGRRHDVFGYRMLASFQMLDILLCSQE